MAGQLVYHWKHGWIPLTHAAALSKAHGSHTGAAKVAKQYGIAGHSGAAPSARVNVRAGVYGGETGHHITGTDSRGRQVKVFAPGDRAAADRAVANIRAGRGAFASQVKAPNRFKVEKSKHLPEGAANSHHVVDTHAGKIARDNKGQLAYFPSSTKAHEFANELNAAHHQGLAPSPAEMDAAGKRHIEETIDKPRAEAAKRSLENAAKIQPGSGAAPSTAAKKGDLALVTKTSNDTVRNDSGSFENRKSVSHFFAHIERVDKNGRVTHVRPLDSHIGQPIEAFRERRSGEHAKLHVVGQDQVNIPALSQAIDNRPHHNFFHGDAGFAEARDLAKAHRGSTPQRIVDVPAGLHVERRSGNGVQSAGWHVVHTESGMTLGFRTDTKAEAEDAAGHLGRTGVNFNQPAEGVRADLKTHQAAVSDVVHKAQVKHGLEPLRASQAGQGKAPAAPESGASEVSSKRAEVEHSGDGTLLHLDRNDTEARAAAKAAGFKWSSNLGSWFLPRNWSEPTRRQKIAQLQGALGHDNVHLEDAGRGVTTTAAEREAEARARAADRATHMDAKAQRLATEADVRFGRAKAIGDMIPFGQPILVGHHSEGRHRRDLAKIDTNMRKGMEAHSEAQAAAAAAERARAATAGDSPLARQRRIDRKEAEVRKIDRALKDHELAQKLSATGRDPRRFGVYPSDPSHVEQMQANRAQLVDEIAHDKAQIAAAGHQTIERANVSAGDVIHYRGRAHVVSKVNQTTVSVPTGYSWDDKVPVNQITRHVKMADLSEASLRSAFTLAKSNPKLRATLLRELNRRGISAADL